MSMQELGHTQLGDHIRLVARNAGIALLGRVVGTDPEAGQCTDQCIGNLNLKEAQEASDQTHEALDTMTY